MAVSRPGFELDTSTGIMLDCAWEKSGVENRCKQEEEVEHRLPSFLPAEPAFSCTGWRDRTRKMLKIVDRGEEDGKRPDGWRGTARQGQPGHPLQVAIELRVRSAESGEG